MTATVPAVRERPLLMSGPMVRAILEGRKTQTRRVVRPQPAVNEGWGGCMRLTFNRRDGKPLLDEAIDAPTPLYPCLCPYGVVGDRLWVRETFRYDGGDRRFVRYAADETVARTRDGAMQRPGWREARWQPSIHMPRWASRLTLELTDVRVQRMQEISAGDCQAEGVRIPCDPKSGNVLLDISSKYAPARYLTSETVENPRALYRAHYASLWDSLNAKRGYGWDVNPWVWVLSFRRLHDRA